MQRSLDRIYTTHVGSLARPPALLDLMRAGAEGQEVDPGELAQAERRAVADVVTRQRADAVLLPGVISHATNIVEHPGHHCRPHRALRRARGPGERGRQRRLRLLLPGDLYPGDPLADRVGQVRGSGRGSAPGHGPAVVTGGLRDGGRW
jgi:hypothetical protein